MDIVAESHVPGRFDGASEDDVHGLDDYSRPIRLNHFGCGDNGQVLGDPLDNIPK